MKSEIAKIGICFIKSNHQKSNQKLRKCCFRGISRVKFSLSPKDATMVVDIVYIYIHDNILPIFISQMLACLLINKSFLTGIFPNVFKIAQLVRVFKAESRIFCSNYRPISLLSNIGKIIEKLMHKKD